jgi:hypothetical protein
MRASDVLRSLFGACAVYATMAACSGAGGSTTALFSATGDRDGAAGNGDGDGASSDTGSGAASGSGSGSSGGSSSSGSSSSGASGSSGSPVPDANADETQSGSRLKAAYYVGGDGSKQFAHWVDSARNNEACAFTVAADGATRCIPTSIAYTLKYADAQCVLPLLETPSGCALSAYVSTFTSSSCPTATVSTGVFPVAALTTPVALYLKAGPSCIATSVSTAYSYYSTGPVISPASFQDAQLQTQ